MHRLKTWKNHCWHKAKPAHWEGAVGALLVTSVWMGAGLSLHERFSSPGDIFPICYFALNIIKCSQLLQVTPLWMESAVSLVYFGLNGCAPLYYFSPQLVYVLFLGSLCVSTSGGAEVKCDPQMSRISPVPSLCSTADSRSWLRKAILVPWAAAILLTCVPCCCMQIRSGHQTHGRLPAPCSVEQYLGVLVCCLLQLPLGKPCRAWFVWATTIKAAGFSFQRLVLEQHLYICFNRSWRFRIY